MSWYKNKFFCSINFQTDWNSNLEAESQIMGHAICPEFKKEGEYLVLSDWALFRGCSAALIFKLTYLYLLYFALPSRRILNTEWGATVSQSSSQHVFPSWMNALQMDCCLYGTFAKSFRSLLLLTSSQPFMPFSIQCVTMSMTWTLWTHKVWLTQLSPTILLHLPSTTSLRLQLLVLAIQRVPRGRVGDGPTMRSPCSLNMSEKIAFLQPQEASTWRKMH